MTDTAALTKHVGLKEFCRVRSEGYKVQIVISNTMDKCCMFFVKMEVKRSLYIFETRSNTWRRNINIVSHGDVVY